MRIINDETEHRLMDPLLIMLVSLSSVLGGMFGLLTGLVPGIHVNTLASILLISHDGHQGSVRDVVGCVDEGEEKVGCECVSGFPAHRPTLRASVEQ